MRLSILAAGCILALAFPGIGVTGSAASTTMGDQAEQQPRQQLKPSIEERNKAQQQQDQRTFRERLRQQRQPEHRQLRPEETLPGERDRRTGEDSDRGSTREERIRPEQQLLPDPTPEAGPPPLHDPQQGDPLRDRPQPSPAQPLDRTEDS